MLLWSQFFKYILHRGKKYWQFLLLKKKRSEKNLPFGVTTLKALFETGLGDPSRIAGEPLPLRTIEKSSGIGGIALISIFENSKPHNGTRKFKF